MLNDPATSPPCPVQSTAEPSGRPIPTDPGVLLFQDEAAHMLGVSARTLESWRLHGGGPKFVRISRGAVRYRRADLESWIGSRVCATTSDLGRAA